MANYDQHPFDRYVQDVMAHLHGLSDEKCAEIQAELRTHLNDAAAELGQHPDDAATQLSVIKRLGSSKQVGRELARSHGIPIAAQGWYIAGGAGALLSAALFTAAIIFLFAGYEEDAVEFFLSISPLALLPVVLVLHRLYRFIDPGWNNATLIVGLVPFGSIAALSLASTVLFVELADVGVLQMSLFTLVGVWLLMIGHLARRAQTIIPPSLTWLGSFVGISWLVLLGSTAVNMVYPQLVGKVSWLLSGNILLLLLIHPLWALWLGSTLLHDGLRRARRA
jgi:hypothetical protein